MDPDAWKVAPARAWTALGILIFLYVFSIVDRTVASILVAPMQETLGVGDFAIGLAIGPAFSLFYALMGLPMGWAVDRFSRRWVVFFGILCWSVATMSCGLSRTFGQLFVSRMAVGMGEATLTPAAHSLISDMFPRRRMTTAMALYTVASLAGVALATYGGGTLLQYLQDRGLHPILPLVGEVEPWQFIFILVGAPGLVFAFLTFALPRLKHIRKSEPSAAAVPTTGSMIGLVRSHPRAFLALLGGGGVNNILLIMSTAWMPTCMMRTFDIGPAQAGLIMAIFLIIGGTGELLSAVLLDKLESRNIRDAPFRLHLILLAIAAPFGTSALLSDSLTLFVPLMMVFMFTVFPPLSFMAAAMQKISPPHLRGRASASYMLAIAMTGSLLGATSVGYMTEHVFQDPKRIADAMALVIIAAVPVAFFFSWQGLASYRSLREANDEPSLVDSQVSLIAAEASQAVGGVRTLSPEREGMTRRTD